MRRFNRSEVLLYQHTKITGMLTLVYILYIYWLTMGYLCCWTVGELREVIALLQLLEFIPAKMLAGLAGPRHNTIRQ